jgi:metal-responsive CopG/Arc/MetJ family transcriptional regulator
MTTVKTAISIQKSLFEQVNSLAEELQMPRSQLFVLAVEEFIQRHRNRNMLQALNEVYADALESDEDTLWREGMRRKHRKLVEGQW